MVKEIKICRLLTKAEETKVRAHETLCEHLSNQEPLYQTIVYLLKAANKNVERIHVIHLVGIVRTQIITGGMDVELKQLAKAVHKTKEELIDLLARLVVHIYDQSGADNMRTWLGCKK